MKIKEFKELINALPDDWQVGYNETYEDGSNINPFYTTVFKALDEFNVDVKNKLIILYNK